LFFFDFKTFYAQKIDHFVSLHEQEALNPAPLASQNLNRCEENVDEEVIATSSASLFCRQK
jgi:hypothetical protein